MQSDNATEPQTWIACAQPRPSCTGQRSSRNIGMLTTGPDVPSRGAVESFSSPPPPIYTSLVILHTEQTCGGANGSRPPAPGRARERGAEAGDHAEHGAQQPPVRVAPRRDRWALGLRFRGHLPGPESAVWGR